MLDFIKEKEVIEGIGLRWLNNDIKRIYFRVDTECTPFVTTNNGITNYFEWCDNKECERYGDKNIEGNWYMLIQDPPE